MQKHDVRSALSPFPYENRIVCQTKSQAGVQRDIDVRRNVDTEHHLTEPGALACLPSSTGRSLLRFWLLAVSL